MVTIDSWNKACAESIQIAKTSSKDVSSEKSTTGKESIAISGKISESEKNITGNLTSDVVSELAPEEIASKLALIVKHLQKKDYRNLFSWPWTDVFAPGFKKLFPEQTTLRQAMSDVSQHKILSALSLYSICYVMFENAAKYGTDNESFLYKYGKKMQEFLLKECQKQFPGFSVPDGEVILNGVDKYSERKRKASFEEGSGDRSPAKLSKLEETVVDLLDRGKDDNEELRTVMDAFVSKNAAGERVLKFVTPEESQETITSHSYVNTQPKFDKAKVQVKPYRYHTVAPFSSHAPAYDSSLSSFSKEDSDLLYEEYFGKPQKQFAREILHFAKKNNFITTYFAEEYFQSVINDPSIPDDLEIPSNLSESNYEPPGQEELEKLKDLSKLGIDVSFLETPESESKEVPKEESLLKNLSANELLDRMMSLQNRRLSQRSVNAKLFNQEELISSVLVEKLADAIGSKSQRADSVVN